MPPAQYNVQDLPLKDLLTLTLREDTAQELLAHYPSLKSIYDASLEELCLVKGLGPAKAYQLKASLELGRRLMLIPPEAKPVLKSPQDVASFLFPMLSHLDREHFLVLHLNTKNRLLAADTVAIGGLNSSPVHPREVFKAAVKRSAKAVILAHNHPSGDPTPSREDAEVTARLVEAGKLLGIEVLDHLVIGEGRYQSFKEDSLL